MTTLPHPFVKYSDAIDIPSDRASDVEEVFEW